MAVTIDIQAVQSIDHPERGIARTVGALVRALEQRHPDKIAGYVYNSALPLPLSLAPLGRDGRLIGTGQLRRRTASVHLVASPFEGSPFDQIWPPAIRLGSTGLAVVLYDLIPLRYPEQYLAHPMPRRRYSARCELVRAADAVLAISEQTARDATDLLGVPIHRVHVVGCAPSPEFHRPRDMEAQARSRQSRFPDVAPRFVLCPGGADWRKNLTELVDAWGDLADLWADGGIDLVITGELGDQHDELIARARRSGAERRMQLTGRVTDEELAVLYHTAELVVFPSRFEGYGLPVMEARQSGTAAIASRNSSLVELLPDEALFDNDAADLAAHLRRALADPDHLARLRELPLPPGHTWPDVADRVADTLTTLDSERKRRVRRRPIQVAVVSPLPPAPSGVADHSQRLLEALSAHAHVHAFTDNLDLVRPPEGVGLHHLRHLGRAGASRGQFDAVVHCWGNSEFHAPMLEAMRTWPGLVLAHDVAVAGLYDWSSRFDPDLVDGASFSQLLRRNAGDRLPRSLRQADQLTYADADSHGLTMAGAVIEMSERYLVHSEAAADLARHERPALADRIGVAPFAFPRTQVPRHPERVGAPPVVATFGIVSLTKCADLVIDVLASMSVRYPEAIAAFVGDIGHGLRGDLEARANSVGVADRVVFTGRVPRETYEQWLSITDVAIQLRRSWGGEASAATADAMASGVPTVVSDIGWARELPDDAVSRVAGDASTNELADAVSQLLTDRELRVVRSRASIDHAAAHGFDRLARHLMDLIVP